MSRPQDKPAWIRSLGFPLLVVGLVAGAWGWIEYDTARRLRAVRVAELSVADHVRAAEVRKESSVERAVVGAARDERREARIQEALARLTATRPTAKCDAALLLGRLGAREHVAALAAVVSSDESASVRNCAAGALVMLGDRQTALRAYAEWANSHDGDLRRSAIVGFGKVGPEAATIALPHLAEALRSPYMDVRYIAVDSLTNLGPAGVPLLNDATRDPDAHVRALAQAALSKTAAKR